MFLTQNHLKKSFDNAKSSGAAFVAIAVTMEGTPEREVIINGKANIDSKLKYYLKTYDENLVHKHSPGIRIVGFTYGEEYAEIEEDLIGISLAGDSDVR